QDTQRCVERGERDQPFDFVEREPMPPAGAGLKQGGNRSSLSEARIADSRISGEDNRAYQPREHDGPDEIARRIARLAGTVRQHYQAALPYDAGIGDDHHASDHTVHSDAIGKVRPVESEKRVATGELPVEKRFAE